MLSNSGPRLTAGGTAGGPDTPGGLVPIAGALVQELGARWVFAASADAPDAPDARPSSLHPVRVPAELMKRQRRDISVGVLLWLFHYLHDTALAPSFGAATASAWAQYGQVNRAFTDVLLELHHNDADEIVLVHDFHLMLVPSLFSAQVKSRISRLAYFHHVPWCEPDYFGMLPERMRTEILESLLCCDTVSFHCERWRQAFVACCERYLKSTSIDRRRVVYRDHATWVTAAPGPIDAAKLDALADAPQTERWRTELRERAAGRRIIARVDRLDLWKNVARGFAAYEDVLSRDRTLADDFWFCAIVSEPRFPTKRHKLYRDACDAIVRRVNDRFGRGRDAATLLYPDRGDAGRFRAVAALQLGATTLVNPTYDGLNMVAKESLVVNPHAPLVLSTNAGVYPQLAAAAIAVHPFDLESTSDALTRAMHERDLPSPGRVSACTAELRRETGAAWLNAILGADNGRDRTF